ncbi:MAG TPA: Gfo/Idh/MocA family oxidoreductase [Mycobacteriales bacterium]|nr:Gfo/Idh/MocA family oxidoreductase [Mycobacteriales bacterium]
MTRTLRVGILGAARIAPSALVRPARRVAGVDVTAIAARDPVRAAAFARKHHVPRVLASYDELIADPDIDAIYNPLPNGLHAQWTLAALAAGKHVLCEKPFTANEAEAQAVADAAAARPELVVMEAYHYRYHALAERMLEIVRGGDLGEIAEVRTWMCFPLPRFADIRYNFALAGGTTMDCCYALHAMRLLGPGEPSVLSATALLRDANVDRAMHATFEFPNGAVGHSITSMWSRQLPKFSLRVTGSRGRMHVRNFIAPQYWHQLAVTVNRTTKRSRMAGEPSYVAQLRAFAAAVTDGGPVATPPEDAVVTMRLIDNVYRAAGLPLRGTPPTPPSATKLA